MTDGIALNNLSLADYRQVFPKRVYCLNRGNHLFSSLGTLYRNLGYTHVVLEKDGEDHLDR